MAVALLPIVIVNSVDETTEVTIKVNPSKLIEVKPVPVPPVKSDINKISPGSIPVVEVVPGKVILTVGEPLAKFIVKAPKSAP